MWGRSGMQDVMLTPHRCAGSDIPHLPFVVVLVTLSPADEMHLALRSNCRLQSKGVRLEAFQLAWVGEAWYCVATGTATEKPAWRPTEARLELIIRSTWGGVQKVC
jgi:hypothetical protein